MSIKKNKIQKGQYENQQMTYQQHQNPLFQKQVPQKYSQPLQRSKLNIKDRRQRNIPQIKVQLDEMLTEAFNEIVMQPRKSEVLGRQDFYVLDNELVKDYVSSVYFQYGIEDPLAGFSSKITNQYQKEVKKSHAKQSTIKKQRFNKTTERISKIKQNFKAELHSPTQVVYETAQKRLSLSDASAKSTTKKVKQIRLSNQRKSQQWSSIKIPQAPKKSHLLTKTKFKYCLICEQALQSDQISQHEKDCQRLQQLIKTPGSIMPKITQILDERINNLKEELQVNQRYLSQDVRTIKLITSQIIQREQNAEQQQYEDPDELDAMKAFSNLTSIKYLQTLDKLQFFKKMRAKALKRSSSS